MTTPTEEPRLATPPASGDDPACHDLVVRIAQRYGVPEEQVARRVRSRRARTHGLLGPRLAARSVAASLALGAAEERLGAHLAAGARHVSGLTVADALFAARAEAARGHLATLGYWSQPGEAPAAIAAHYVEAIQGIAREGLGASVSIKADLLGYDAGLVDKVVAAGRANAVRVHFDAQGPETIDRTHALVARAVAAGADVSATLPARFLRSMDDAARVIEWGIPVRVVKGQGGDPEHPRIDPRQAFVALVDRLAGHAAHVGVATHDRRAAEPALRRLQACGTPCSLEQMRSLPRLDEMARAHGVPVRVYVAYGRFGLPYALGELARRPAIVGWILRDLLLRHRPVDDGAPR